MIENTMREYLAKRGLEDGFTDEEIESLEPSWQKVVKNKHKYSLRDIMKIIVSKYDYLTNWAFDMVERGYCDPEKSFRVYRDKEYLDTAYRPILNVFLDHEFETEILKEYKYRVDFYNSVKDKLENINFYDLTDELMIMNAIYNHEYGKDDGNDSYEIYLGDRLYEESLIFSFDINKMSIGDLMKVLTDFYPNLKEKIEKIDAEEFFVLRSHELRDFGYRPIIDIYHKNESLSDLKLKDDKNKFRLLKLPKDVLLAELNTFINIYQK
ncbi:MAG: hypothetical protein Q4P29_07225 [Tissierellia bacterium]|nr:hypothetical protein [Tissierellia bacterium]